MDSMSAGARELALFIKNDGPLYRQQWQPIIKNLATKKAKGAYDHANAVKTFMYLMESGAKKYVKEHGGEWFKVFPPRDREQAARYFVDAFEAEYKKYQDKAPKPVRRGRSK